MCSCDTANSYCCQSLPVCASCYSERLHLDISPACFTVWQIKCSYFPHQCLFCIITCMISYVSPSSMGKPLVSAQWRVSLSRCADASDLPREDVPALCYGSPVLWQPCAMAALCCVSIDLMNLWSMGKLVLSCVLTFRWDVHVKYLIDDLIKLSGMDCSTVPA